MIRKTVTLTVLVSMVVFLTAGPSLAQEKEKYKYAGVGFGLREVTGSEVNMWAIAAHAVIGMTPVFALAGDFNWGWRTYRTISSSATTDRDNQGWNLNVLIMAQVPVGNSGVVLNFGPGLAVINHETETVSGSTTTKTDYGTNLGFVAGMGAVIPIQEKWIGFFTYRHAVVTGDFPTSSGSGQSEIGGPSTIVGVGRNF